MELVSAYSTAKFINDLSDFKRELMELEKPETMFFNENNLSTRLYVKGLIRDNQKRLLISFLKKTNQYVEHRKYNECTQVELNSLLDKLKMDILGL